MKIQEDHAVPFLSFALACLLFILSPYSNAQTRDVTEMRTRLEPPYIGAMTVRSHRESLGDNGERIVDWNFDVEGAGYGENPRSSIGVEWDPSGKIINGTREMAESSARSGGNPLHTVAGWPVGLILIRSDGYNYATVKGNYYVHVSVSDASSTTEAERLADEAFEYILSRIPDPAGGTGNSETAKAGTGAPGEAGKVPQKTAAEQQMERAFKAFEEEQKEYIDAANQADAAMMDHYRDGAGIAEKAANSEKALVEIIPPTSRLAIFRDGEQRFGVAVANRSDFDLSRIRLRLYVHTRNGIKEIGSARIDRVRRNGSSTAAFSMSGRKLKELYEKEGISDTDIEIKAAYRVYWTDYYYGSEDIDALWPNGLNPRLDGLPSEEERENRAPPRIRIELVDETGSPRPDNIIVSGTRNFIRLAIESSSQETSCLAAYSEPHWSNRPGELRYSGWGDAYNQRPPRDLLPDMDRFNGTSNPRFSGDLMGGSVYFYAFFIAPSVKQEENLTVSLSYKYAFDTNLAGQEEYWREGEGKATFTLTRGRTSSSLSDIVQLNVTATREEKKATVALTLPGGQIGCFRGSIVELAPTDRWWPDMLEDWRKRNQEMMDYDLSKKVRQGGREQMVGDIISAYDQGLGTGLAAAFAMDDIVAAETEDEVIKETGTAAAGLLIPAGGVMLPVLEMGFMWAKRQKEEAGMLQELNRIGPVVPFRQATMYRSVDQLYGTRIMYKIVDDTLYLIPLGKTSL